MTRPRRRALARVLITIPLALAGACGADDDGRPVVPGDEPGTSLAPGPSTTQGTPGY